MLLEAFLVFWLLELLVVLGVIAWYYYEPQVKSKPIHDPWGFWRQDL